MLKKRKKHEKSTERYLFLTNTVPRSEWSCFFRKKPDPCILLMPGKADPDRT